MKVKMAIKEIKEVLSNIDFCEYCNYSDFKNDIMSLPLEELIVTTHDFFGYLNQINDIIEEVEQ